ncbi:MAG TPA: endo-1,4-beta-xylanase [Verrucomicrobiae bacterium]|nr:endo-1,4-beta-xylanase [Verrucomicrobiae bacterium]
MKILLSTAVLGIVLAWSATAETTLKDAFHGDFLIGAALNESQFCESNSLEAAIVKAQFDSISPENALKWERIHPLPGQYDFTGADCYVRFGVTNGMTIIGHNLIWHSQTPNWVFRDDRGNLVSRDTLLARMREHIDTVMGRYKGRIYGWDVVNEALNADGTLRNSPWRKIIGDDYIAKAFEFAREADPEAQLYYNDYGLEKADKRAGAVALIKKLQAAGIKIDGIGLQGHYGLDEPSLQNVDETITTFEKLGLKVMITELDVNLLPSPKRGLSADVSERYRMRQGFNPYTNGLPASVQKELARRYAGLFGVFLKHRDCVTRVTLWGVTDGDSWLNDYPIRGRTAYPLLFDREGNPKAAFRAVIATAGEVAGKP